MSVIYQRLIRALAANSWVYLKLSQVLARCTHVSVKFELTCTVLKGGRHANFFFYKVDKFIYCMIRIWFELHFCGMISWWNKQLKCFRWNISRGRAKICWRHKLNAQRNAIALAVKTSLWIKTLVIGIIKQWVSMCQPSTTIQLKVIFGLNRVFCHEALAWLFESIGVAQQSICWFYKEMKCVFMLSKWRKGYWKPKHHAIAS